jgi:hypothetical protein
LASAIVVADNALALRCLARPAAPSAWPKPSTLLVIISFIVVAALKQVFPRRVAADLATRPATSPAD